MTSVNLDSNVYAQQQDNEENWQRERETCLVWSGVYNYQHLRSMDGLDNDLDVKYKCNK